MQWLVFASVLQVGTTGGDDAQNLILVELLCRF